MAKDINNFMEKFNLTRRCCIIVWDHLVSYLACMHRQSMNTELYTLHSM